MAAKKLSDTARIDAILALLAANGISLPKELAPPPKDEPADAS